MEVVGELTDHRRLSSYTGSGTIKLRWEPMRDTHAHSNSAMKPIPSGGNEHFILHMNFVIKSSGMMQAKSMFQFFRKGI